MPSVRAKMKVTQVTFFAATPNYAVLELNAEYSTHPEDNSFSVATPNAHMTMTVTNPAAIDLLEVGQTFYLDFTPASQ